MRAPSFWWDERPGLMASVLAPVGAVYGAVTARRMARAGTRVAVPVVCIGNFVAGGAGKTPTAIAVATRLQALGAHPAFVSRGYGGQERGPLHVLPEQHRARDVGDEPLLLARTADVVVARDRVAGAELAIALGADAVVLDDGLQNPGLVKSLTFAVVDAATGLGNGLPLPAGPLRAPVETQLPHVDALVLIGEGHAGDRLLPLARRIGLPVLRGVLQPDAAAAAALRDHPVLAFAGIGRPDKFFTTLAACGAVIAERVSFADHHAYGRELTALVARAEARGLTPVTTEKDLVRLAGDVDLAPLVPRIKPLPVTLAFDDTAAVDALLRDALGGPSA